tara:strand:- start:1776 stop:1934 length:159 start_codon:yes stop_codon:yes gene_type:complete
MSKKLLNDSPYFDFVDIDILNLYQEHPEYLFNMCTLISLDIQLEKEGTVLEY